MALYVGMLTPMNYINWLHCPLAPGGVWPMGGTVRRWGKGKNQGGFFSPQFCSCQVIMGWLCLSIKEHSSCQALLPFGRPHLPVRPSGVKSSLLLLPLGYCISPCFLKTEVIQVCFRDPLGPCTTFRDCMRSNLSSFNMMIRCYLPFPQQMECTSKHTAIFY